MAEVVSAARLLALLAEARDRGGSLVWMESGRLVAGPRLGRAAVAIDFAGERLVRLARVPAAPDSGERAAEGAEPAAGRYEEAAIRIADELVAEGPRRAGRRTGSYHLGIGERRFGAASARELLVFALRLFERVRPGTLERLAAEKGRSKRVVARNPDDLYAAGRPGAFAEEIEGPWWVAVNNSFAEVERFIRRGAGHAGLEVEIGRTA